MSAHRLLYDKLAAPHKMTTPVSGTTISIDRDEAVVPITTGAGAFTLTITQPTAAGRKMSVNLVTDGGGDATVTLTGGWNAAGDTTMTFGDAGDFASFESVQSGASYYWRCIRAEGVAEVVAEDIDVHALTALGAVPDAADLVAISDESTAGDPTRSVTVTQLLTAAGDMTDLGAVPDVADRILLTDESAGGDPAVSTTVENFFSALGDVTALGAAPATDDRLAITDESAGGDPIKSITVAELFQTYFNDMTPGTGISTGVGTICEHSIEKVGGLYKTTILIDLTGLNSGGTDGDIIGKDGTANSHIGQVTAALNGTIFAGQVTCLETPAGGEPDIDVYSATEGTGTEDAAVGGLTEKKLLESAADWSAGGVKALAAYPAANEYLYLVASGGVTDATYTAGIFMVELWGK